MKIYDTIIIGGGQAGLSVAYFLRRHKELDYLILDDQDRAGGAWLQTWDSLKLFSPVQYSSLSGWMMPKGDQEYPSKHEFLKYLNAYEKRYDFPIQRKTKILSVQKENLLFKIETNQGFLYSKTLVSATGNSHNPFIPHYPKQDIFTGKQLHSIDYKNPKGLENKKVLIVGGGNSGAQILAEVSKTSETTWTTLEEPFFLPEEIDGRYLFTAATNSFYGKPNKPLNVDSSKVSLNNIVQVQSVKEARDRNVFNSKRPFSSFYKNGVIWNNGEKQEFDVIIWCTGFRANLKHLESLNIIENNRIQTNYTRSVKEPNLWLVGYGSWTGFASATIYGVGKTARQTVSELVQALK